MDKQFYIRQNSVPQLSFLWISVVTVKKLNYLILKLYILGFCRLEKMEQDIL